MLFKDFYAGKTILLTGCTGFLGKVVLEKCLRSLPMIKKIYIMVRPKRNQTIQERIETTIFSSEIFSRVFSENPGLRERLSEVVIPFAGDLIIKGLGISKEDRETLTSEVDLIINCAASINFDDPLLDAIQINYLGCLKMLDLAKQCKKLLAHVHVSTAYVNSNTEGFIEEKIYDLEGNEDPEERINTILKMNPQYINENEKELIGSYPNTYTFTKSMAERVFKKRAMGLRAAIVRPAIIIAAKDEPFPGWTDSLAAAGGLTLSICIGILKQIRMKENGTLDVVPADYCSNLILATTVFTGCAPSPTLNIVHSSSS